MNEAALALVAEQAIGLIDLTRLDEDDTEQQIRELCQQAITPVGSVAAICVYPRFIDTVAKELGRLNLGQQVAIATVVNFPHGEHSVEQVEQDITAAIAAGAHEIDLVLPYRQLMAGNTDTALTMVKAAKAICIKGSACLKVIIESGELGHVSLIRQASELAIAGGADFVKTSTGKVAINATLAASEVILTSIRDSQKDVGFKAAGGVRTTAEAQQYLQLAKQIMGPNWVTPAHFRFGASSLLAQLLNSLS
ncbi:deoxyribose-phosphate aldolase [Oceanisphaera pacifica]|nr:deoxyribose-phosphate aldolase [Oceanisphaera pacifica]